VPYLLTLFHRPTFLLSLLSLTSLASTAYLLWMLPAARTGIPVLDGWAARGPDAAPDAAPGEDDGGGENRRRTTSFRLERPHKSPLEAHLPLLNGALCAVVLLLGLLTHGDGGRLGRLGLGYLPAAVYGVVLVAKVVMAGVDPESDLGVLRYEYKGA
jgi:hypothetical protein